MDRKRISKARLRISAAEVALDLVEKAKKKKDFEIQWYYFLVAAKNAITQIVEGAKADPSSQRWDEEKRAIREADPLINYIYEARNDDEHGLGNPTEFRPGGLEIGSNRAGSSQEFSVSMRTDHLGNIVEFDARSLDGLPIDMQSTSDRMVLVTVTDRKGRKIDPPMQHLGVDLKENSPATVGRLMIDYLKNLVDEADQLFP